MCIKVFDVVLQLLEIFLPLLLFFFVIQFQHILFCAIQRGVNTELFWIYL